MPKAFKFRLEQLQDFRQLKKDLAARDLGMARKAVFDQNRLLLGLLGEEDEGKVALRTLKTRSLDLMQVRLQEGYLISVERRIRRGYERLQELVRAETEKRRALTEATKGVRVLERLRERQRKAYAYELGRQEQKFLDEVAQNINRES